MPDAVVMLTPILVLAVLLLLGYAGCHEVFGGPPPPSTLCTRLRVPAALTVTEIAVRIVRQGGETTLVRTPNPIPGSTEDGDNVFTFWDGQPLAGEWTVSCQVTVVENGTTDDDLGQGTFMLDGSNDFPCANFQASVSGGTLDVVFRGVT